MHISIIINTYNRPNYLKKVIDGFLYQTHLPNELVIADDGSEEETVLMVRNIQQNSKIKIIHIWHEDRGFRLAKIRNKAIANSSGEYLLICDDDSIPAPTLVEDHLSFAEKGYFIQGHRVLIGPEASEYFTFNDISLLKLWKLSAKRQANFVLNGLILPFPLIRVSQELYGTRGCNMSFFRKDFIAINGFNEEFEGWGREDTELIARFYKYGLRRKDIKFRACCYHLYHSLYGRENLEKNTILLKKIQKRNEYFCSNGIDKYFT